MWTIFLRALASVAALCLVVTASHASTAYPSKPVTMIVAVTAGSGPDVLARIVADRLSQMWGQQITVMNKPGNFGAIALHAVTTAPADGHTFVASIASSFIVWPEIQKAAAIELQRETISIGLLGVQPMVIAVNPTLGANTLPELIAIIRQRPDEILYGGSRATLPHLTGLRMASAAALKWRYIPSTAPRAVQDAIGGSIHVVIESMAALASPMQAGLLKGLAVVSTSRLPDLPELPTVAEVIPQLSGFDARGWVALMARTGTSEAIIEKINRDIRTIMTDSNIVRRLYALGVYPRPLTSDQTTAFIQQEKDAWRPIVQSLDLATQ